MNTMFVCVCVISVEVVEIEMYYTFTIITYSYIVRYTSFSVDAFIHHFRTEKNVFNAVLTEI